MAADFAEFHDELRAVARDLLAPTSPLVSGGEPVTADWRRFVGAGWTGLEVPEDLGGAGASFAEVAVVLEELGRAATASPFLGAVLAVGALRLVAPSAERDELLAGIATGDVLATVALNTGDAGPGVGSASCFRLDRGGAGARLVGQASFVPDTVGADRVLVLADDPRGGTVLVDATPTAAEDSDVHVADAPPVGGGAGGGGDDTVVEAGGPGGGADDTLVEGGDQHGGADDTVVEGGGPGRGRGNTLVVDGRPGVEVRETPVVDPTRSLGAVVAGGAPVDAARCWPLEGDPASLLARGALAVALDSLGLAQTALDVTVAYVAERRQFGRPVGSFQAVKHACADVAVELTIARRLVADAVGELVELVDGAPDGPGVSAATAMAKAHAVETAVAATGTALQLHGGIGYTWEHGLHAFVKRAALNRSLFGSPAAHRARVAERYDVAR